MLTTTLQDVKSVIRKEPRLQDETLPLYQESWYEPGKALVEFLAALVLLVLAAPVILLAAVAVKLTSAGPAFYSQSRLGRHGRRFRIYKLRSMVQDAERDLGACWSTSGDTRITPVGRFLRRTHIDELPQLWNVLRGEMSLVGPRPERPEFVRYLEQVIPLYRARLLVRPGLTGLAQVQLHADTNLESVRRKLRYDLYYVCRQNSWLDLRILTATIFHVAGVPYGWLSKLIRLPREEAMERTYQELIAEANSPHPDEADLVGEPIHEAVASCAVGT